MEKGKEGELEKSKEGELGKDEESEFEKYIRENGEHGESVKLIQHLTEPLPKDD